MSPAHQVLPPASPASAVRPVSIHRLSRIFTSRPLRAALHLEHHFYGIMARHGLLVTRIALGIIFLWFGILKFMPAMTPIDSLAERTLTMITFHLIRPEILLHLLAAWEIVIGLGLLTGRFLGLTLALLFLHLPGTFLPLVLFLHKTWIHFPVLPTLEGQYIIKNFVLVAAAVVIGSSARGGKIIAHPGVAIKAERLELAAEERDLRATEKSIHGNISEAT